MRILLCVVRSNRYFFAPPLGLAYIASYLLREGHQVKIVDDYYHSDFQKGHIKKELLSFVPDIVGFTTHTFTINCCFHAASMIKEIDPKIRVVFGGPHATYLPLEVLSNKNVDIIVTGEGEETMVELVRALENKATLKEIKGIVYKDTGESIVDNGPRELIQDLDSIPFPAYKLLDMKKYHASAVFKCSSEKQFGTILTSRGCSHQCTFCSHRMFGKKVRMRSPENVVDEMEFLANQCGTREVIFMDDAFMADNKRVSKLCDLILEKKLRMSWGCNCRSDQVSAEIFSKMKDAGCGVVFIGAESGSQEMLDRMKKNISIKQIAKSVELAKKHIRQVICGFILGMPGDNLEKARQTIDFSKKLNPDYALFTIAVPFPGSEIFDDAIHSGKLDKETAVWWKYNLFPLEMPAFELSNIRREELINLAKKAFWEFYLRPAYIISRLGKIKCREDFLQHFYGFLAFLRLFRN